MPLWIAFVLFDRMKRLDQYKARLSPAEIAAGMTAARRNAARLAQDARALLDANRFPTAAALAALSIEESGKTTILRQLALARTDEETREAWRDYRSHTRKNAAWIVPELVARGARSLEDFRTLFDSDADHPYLLDQVKQIGLYTDCLGAVHWSNPAEVVDRDLAELLVRTAELLGSEREVTTEEVELWVKHVGPVWKGPMQFMRRAVLNWHTEMVERGLLDQASGDMSAFLFPPT